MLKQVIIVRSDLGMSAGKLAAQSCHASLGSYLKAGVAVRKLWEASGAKKVVLSCEGVEALRDLEVKARALRLPHFMVADAGLTELTPGTVTALGVGPASEELINKLSGSLKLLK